MSLYQAYLNWRLERIRKAAKAVEGRLDESVMGDEKPTAALEKPVFNPNYLYSLHWNPQQKLYIRKLIELGAKESALVKRLSSVGGN